MFAKSRSTTQIFCFKNINCFYVRNFFFIRSIYFAIVSVLVLDHFAHFPLAQCSLPFFIFLNMKIKGDKKEIKEPRQKWFVFGLQTPGYETLTLWSFSLQIEAIFSHGKQVPAVAWSTPNSGKITSIWQLDTSFTSEDLLSVVMHARLLIFIKRSGRSLQQQPKNPLKSSWTVNRPRLFAWHSANSMYAKGKTYRLSHITHIHFKALKIAQ